MEQAARAGIERRVYDPAAAARLQRRRGWRKLLAKVPIYVVLTLGGILLSVPLVWLLSSSFKTNEAIFRYPPEWIPRPLQWQNYVEIWRRIDFALYTRNTMIIVTLAVIGGTFSSAFVAFGFARLRFPGRDVIFLILLGTMMIPFHVTLIPTFVLYKWLDWLDTFRPFTVVPWFGGSAFSVFLIRQFYMTLPLELDDAARIDGCNSFDIFFRIILPQAKPVLGVVAIFGFMGNWNGFMLPLIFLQSPEKYPLALAINMLRGSQYGTKWHLLMAASVIMSMPCIILYFLAQRYFVQGIVFSGVEK